jgi:hypothetical protein
MIDFAPLTEHNPRPVGDPDFVPWWAKGEYARKNGTKYTTESGVVIVGGKATGRLSVAPRLAPVPKAQPRVVSVPETPRKAPATPREPDLAQRLVAQCPFPVLRSALCNEYGIDPAILLDAPNNGVATMRLLNALRKALREKAA